MIYYCEDGRLQLRQRPYCFQKNCVREINEKSLFTTFKKKKFFLESKTSKFYDFPHTIFLEIIGDTRIRRL